jgi:hypothetical protein
MHAPIALYQGMTKVVPKNHNNQIEHENADRKVRVRHLLSLSKSS